MVASTNIFFIHHLSWFVHFCVHLGDSSVGTHPARQIFSALANRLEFTPVPYATIDTI
jgi:hypothetical protein